MGRKGTRIRMIWLEVPDLVALLCHNEKFLYVSESQMQRHLETGKPYRTRIGNIEGIQYTEAGVWVLLDFIEEQLHNYNQQQEAEAQFREERRQENQRATEEILTQEESPTFDPFQCRIVWPTRDTLAFEEKPAPS